MNIERTVRTPVCATKNNAVSRPRKAGSPTTTLTDGYAGSTVSFKHSAYQSTPSTDPSLADKAKAVGKYAAKAGFVSTLSLAGGIAGVAGAVWISNLGALMGPTAGIVAGAGALAAGSRPSLVTLAPVGLSLMAGGLAAAELDNPVSMAVSLAAVITSGFTGATLLSGIGGEMVDSKNAGAELKKAFPG